MTPTCSALIISLIAATSENHVIGLNNKLPWHLPDELNYFRRTTAGHLVMMGRRTYESIGHALPSRINIVLSRDSHFRPSDAHVVSSLDAALRLAQKLSTKPEIFVIGGESLYRIAAPLVQRLYLTRVHADISGDTYFPLVGWERDFQVIRRERFDHEDIPYTIMLAERKQGSKN